MKGLSPSCGRVIHVGHTVTWFQTGTTDWKEFLMMMRLPAQPDPPRHFHAPGDLHALSLPVLVCQCVACKVNNKNDRLIGNGSIEGSAEHGLQAEDLGLMPNHQQKMRAMLDIFIRPSFEDAVLSGIAESSSRRMTQKRFLTLSGNRSIRKSLEATAFLSCLP